MPSRKKTTRVSKASAKKPVYKKRKSPRVHLRKDQEGHIVYEENLAKTTTAQAKPSYSPILLPTFFVIGITLLVYYVMSANRISFQLSSKSSSQAQSVEPEKKQTPQKPTVPVLKEGAEEQPKFTAKGIYAIDPDTQTVLFNKNEKNPLLPASTTKMTTALVAMQAYKDDDVLTAVSRIPGQTMGLYAGEKITFDNLLHALLIYSANDAAETIAANFPGGRAAFVEAMNKFAEDNGLAKTHFTNPVGFDEYLHFSTPQDMEKIAEIGMKNPKFAEIVGTKGYTATNIDGTITHPVTNTNILLGKVDGVVGIKTGHTTTSGESLVTLVDRNGKKVIIAMLGSTDRFGETTKLIDWIYNNYDWPQE